VRNPEAKNFYETVVIDLKLGKFTHADAGLA